MSEPFVPHFQSHTPNFATAGQLLPEHMSLIKAQGFQTVINNRPDGEAGPNQPTSDQMQQAAEAVGLVYHHLPVISGQMTEANVIAMKDLLVSISSPVLAFCRSGSRSTQLWRAANAMIAAQDQAPNPCGSAQCQCEATPTPTPTPSCCATKAESESASTSCCTPKATPEATMIWGSTHDIVIVGGGAAGIATAASLLKRQSHLRITIIEPSDKHYYQPAWTLVGAGQFDVQDTVRNMADVMPQGVTWIKAHVTAFHPNQNGLTLSNGNTLQYTHLVVATGIQLNWGAIEGLLETLGKNGVTSNYRYDLAPYTYQLVQQTRQGRAIFTQPAMPIKCAGAPQKAMYLSCSNWERAGVLNNIQVEMYNTGAVLFGVAAFVPPLMEYVKRYNAQLNFNATLTRIDGSAKKAWFNVKNEQGEVQTIERTFDMIHVCPPQSAPDVVKQSALADAAGWVEVDPATLQHPRFPNVFGVGDVCSAPNAKTAAAARKQVVVVAENLLALRAGQALPTRYDGYGSCPLTVEIGKIVLAEFGYGGKLLPTFPLNPAVARWSSWVLKKTILPWIYWNAMLKGREWLARSVQN